MGIGRRAFFALLGLACASTIACSGGHSGGSGAGPPATAAPTQVPSSGPSTEPSFGTPGPSPTPFQTPAALPPPATPGPLTPDAALNVPSRPITSGDFFALAGRTVQSFLYRNVAPQPSVTTNSTVAQNITVSGPVSFNGQTNAFDFVTVESDTSTSPSVQLNTTTNGYYGTAPSGGSTGLFTFGYTSSDSDNTEISVTYPGAGQLLDLLPETGGAQWSNSAAQTFNESEADGFTAARSENADGSYVENDVIPQPSQFSTPAPLTAMLTENSDGSGSYAFPLDGVLPNVTINYGAPQGGSIAISIVDPTGQNAPLDFSVAGWFSTPLYAESDTDDGAQAIPTGCNVATFATLADAIDQRIQRIDTVDGTHEWFDQITYVVPNDGPVCVTLNDVIYAYYDLTGQGNEAPLGLTFSGGSSPLQVDDLTTTLALTSATLQSVGRRPDAAKVSSVSLRIADARTRFLATLERRRAQRMELVARHLSALFRERRKHHR